MGTAHRLVSEAAPSLKDLHKLWLLSLDARVLSRLHRKNRTPKVRHRSHSDKRDHLKYKQEQQQQQQPQQQQE